MPGVRRAWERYIEPNLPAPMRATRTGCPRAARASSRRCRFIGRRGLQLQWRVPQEVTGGMEVYRHGGENSAMGDQRTLEMTGLEARLAVLRPGLDLLGLA